MEAFGGKVDPQRLEKLDKRIGPPENSIAIASVAIETSTVATSESDNSQNENMLHVESSNEPKPVTTPDNNKRSRKRKQDTPQESRSTKAIKNQRPINAYFDLENRTPTRRAIDNGVSRNILGTNDHSNDYAGVTPIDGTPTSNNTKSKRTRPSQTTRHQDCQTDMTRSELERLESGQAQKASAEKDDLVRQNMRFQSELAHARRNAEKYEEKFKRCIKLTKDMLKKKCEHDKREARRKSMEDRLRLGDWTTYRYNNDQWNNGTAFNDLEDRDAQLKETRKTIESARKALSQRRPPSTAAQGTNAKHRDNALSAEEYNTQDWVLRNRLQQLKKDEQDLQYEKDKLHRERSLHIREMKRIQHEDASRYKNNIELNNNRYLLLNLLGKGGFSEVYKAYDSQEQRMVAIKIHQLNQDWTDQKKADYQRHARREAEIQKSIEHDKIVRLYDRFEVDINTFCTVLEFCEGNDLDHFLKQHKQISENEAKTIIMQIVQALKYLNELDKPVIHYDLKPGNILLADGSVCGNIKITDFGLSKINDGKEGNEGIELTSQGAGTYWYLPPECFTRPDDRAPKIDNRVDVWSIGVIFYQCIYGKKPFGNNQSQQQILENKTIVNATEVNFPPKPNLSDDAKNFIRSCLIYRKDDRADIFSLASHHYFKQTPRRSASLKPPTALGTNENSN